MARSRFGKIDPAAIVSSRPAGFAASGPSGLERQFALICRTLGLSPVAELPFALEVGRHWRFDFAWPDHRIAVEVDGGAWSQGRHTRGSGFEEDCRKLNASAALGWRVLRFTSDMLDSGEAREVLEALIEIEGLPVLPGSTAR